MNWTYSPFIGGVVTDLDTGLIYGIDGISGIPDKGTDSTDVPLRLAEFNPVNKSLTYVEKRGHPGAMMWVWMVYSSAAKRIFGYEHNFFADDVEALWSYGITSKDWTQVKATGDIPPTRSSPCFVSAYGGKKLILAGGIGVKQSNILNDVYSLDVSTLTWTKLPNMPLALFGQNCAVSGDSFITMGGLKSLEVAKDVEVANDEGPAILNLTSNTWGKRYTPTRLTPPSPTPPSPTPPRPTPGQKPSSADRTHLTLSKAGFVALAVISAAASSLITL
ncbi:hypothetical protein BGZ65_009681 [Modicella reniformis]|uniref:Kelch repeat-containing protein n=1 Tax=Modicella reniformis TaxID=1440133 RepID=A0A9P6LRZ1_9FUNG|nr:hypothetical protein BGZ65_009681 [Modicella reniformis]